MGSIKSPRNALIVGAVILFLLAVAFVVIGQSKIDSAEQFNQAQASKEATLPPVVDSSKTTVTPTPSPSMQPSTTPSTQSAEPTVTSTVVSSETVSAVREVAPAAPENLTITSLSNDLDLTVKVDAMPYNDELKAPSCTYDPDPECPEKAYWVSDTMGVAPGSSTDNSTYIVGHSWTQAARVFDRLSDYAMTHYETDEDGHPVVTMMPSVFDSTGGSQEIPVWNVPGLLGATMSTKTANGILTYRVTNVFVAEKVDIGYIYAFQHGTPNTLVVETCGIDSVHKVDTEYGVVMIGTLATAEPNA